LLLIGASFEATAYAAPSVSFASAVHYPLPGQGDNAHVVAVGALRGGQVEDVVTGDTNGNVTVFLNNGDGTFAPGVDYATGGGAVTALAIADVNGDHVPDVIATVGNGIYAFLGTGTGGLKAPYPVLNYDNGSGDGASALAVGDFLHNGQTDLAVGYNPAGANHDVIRIFSNDGTGQFSYFEMLPVGNTYVGVGSLSAADLTGDGVPDLVASVGGNSVTSCGGVIPYINGGSGNFTDQGALPNICSEPGRVAAADFDGDGHIDVAAADSCSDFCGTPAQVVRVYFGAGDGTFPRSEDIPLPVGNPGQSISADLNGDGHPDIVATCGGSCAASMQVLVNNGDGTFTDGPQLSGDNMDLAAGTFTSGCLPDIASVGNDLTILLNTTAGSSSCGTPSSPVCPPGEVGSPPNCAPAPPPDVSGGGPPTPTCADHVRSFGPFTVYGACFTEPKPGVFLASGRVRLNGVDIDPGASGSVTIDTTALSITATGNVSVRLGTYQIFHKTGTWKKSIKLPLTLSSPSGLKVKGLPISGQLDLAPVPDGMDVTAQAGIGFLHLTGDVGLHLSNQAGLSVKKLDIKVGNVPLGPLASIQGGSLAYSHTSDGHDKWSAMVTVKLPPGFPTMMGNLEILDGTLSDIRVNANDINRDFVGIVFLQSLGLDVKLVPHLAVTGSIGLSAGPKIPVLNVKALSLSASLTADFGQPVVFTATGKLKVADKVDLANATARWAVPSQFSATGHIEGGIGPPWLGVHASADASVAVASDGFAVKGQGSVSVGPTNGQGLVYVSEKGIVALAYASGPTVLGVTIAPVCAGVGYHWGGSVDWYADDGCAGAMSFSSSGHFASTDARQASSSYGIKVPPGDTQVELGATAAHGYPEFTLRSPSGHLISGAAGTIGTLGRGTYLFVADPARHGTYVLISRPESGTWTLTPTAASVAITDVARATSLRPVRVTTRVRRRGPLWLLTWHASALSGAKLRFSDIGPLGEKTIITTSRSAGSVTFADFNDGVGGRHHIEILVARNGLPQATIVGSSFTIPRPFGPPKPHALRLRHEGSTAVLTWAPAPGAYLYAVLITTSDGQRRFYDQPANQRRVTLGHVLAPDVVSASIRTVALTGLESRAANTNLRVSVKPGR
jgi:hypothetical protein